MTDAEVLAEIEAAAEYVAWLCDMGRADFDARDALAAVVRELRARQRDASGLTGWPSWPLALIGWRDAA